jgi:TRAP transporter 4TM/12TM fusion protein
MAVHEGMNDTAPTRHLNRIRTSIERVTGGNLRAWVALVAIAMSAYQLAVAWLGQPVTFVHLPLHLTFVFVVLFWSIPAFRKPGYERLEFAWNLFLTALALGAGGYLVANVDYVQTRIVTITPLTWIEYVLGTGLLLLVLEAVRRTIGWVLVIVVVAFLAYAQLGAYLPYPFWHRGFSAGRILEQTYLTTDGIWATPLDVTAAYVFLFILFGALLLHSGAGRFFTNLANSLTGRASGGPAKVAVVASTFMGMLSGSSAANVVTTGSFTIPAMKRRGYSAEFAGGVEAAASANGQLTPPIMGAAAFIMMEFLGISYVEVMGYAAIPAFLCFFAVYVMVHLEARRLNLLAEPEVQGPSVVGMLRSQGYLLLSVAVLMYFLVEGYTPARACFWSIVALVGLLVAFDGGSRRRILHVVLGAMADAPRLVASVSAACAAAGVIMGMVLLTGVGLKISTLILYLAGGNLLLTLILTMIVAVILGMGMPTSGAYIILAVLLAPAMIKLGVLPIAAHMFVLYCASKSSLTPPVAVASYAAAAIAESDPWRTSLVAFRIAITVFLIPYMFVFGPTLLGIGAPLEVAWSLVTALVGLVALGGAAIGWMRTELRIYERVLLLAAALAMLKSGWPTDAAGLALGALAGLSIYLRAGRASKEATARDIG